jgi:cell wall assembly regulator SMI1
VLAGLAAAASSLGATEAAARLWGAVERLEDELEHRLPDRVRLSYEQRVGDPDRRLVEAGRELALEDARALARSF